MKADCGGAATLGCLRGGSGDWGRGGEGLAFDLMPRGECDRAGKRARENTLRRERETERTSKHTPRTHLDHITTLSHTHTSHHSIPFTHTFHHSIHSH